MAASHILTDLPDNPFLGSGEFIRKSLEAGVEGFSHGRHLKANGAAASDVFLLEKTQLKEEKFLKFEPVCSFGQGVLTYRKMYLTQCIS